MGRRREEGAGGPGQEAGSRARPQRQGPDGPARPGPGSAAAGAPSALAVAPWAPAGQRPPVSCRAPMCVPCAPPHRGPCRVTLTCGVSTEEGRGPPTPQRSSGESGEPARRAGLCWHRALWVPPQASGADARRGGPHRGGGGEAEQRLWTPRRPRLFLSRLRCQWARVRGRVAPALPPFADTSRTTQPATQLAFTR